MRVWGLLLAALATACGDNFDADDADDADACDVCAEGATCDATLEPPCSCPAGYSGDGTAAGSGCTDIDECAAGTDDCVDTTATCANTAGSFTCACVSGYTGDGTTGGSGCTAGGGGAVNECADETDDCVAGATCVDTADGFTCTCAAGFTGDGTASGSGCTDIDECTTGTDSCVDTIATCTDIDGSFTCACIAGYTGDGDTEGTGCTDIDECTLDTDDCGALDCVNAPGNFSCFTWLTPGPFENFLDRRSASFVLLDRLEVTSPAGTVTGINSMAQDPITGTIYVIIKVSAVSGRVLATLDPATAVATEVGNLGDNFASLAFDATGQLWGVTGDGATTPETLFRIDKATGAPTLARALGTGADGECIAYHPTLNLLYHWSGNGTVTAETIDIASVTLDLAPITITGTPTGEVFGCLFDATLDAFRIWDIGSNVHTMAADGTYSAVLFNTGARDLRTSLYLPTSGHIVSPASGPLAGGTAITLSGVGLDLHGAPPTVTVGGVAATDVVVADSNTIQAVTPAGAGAGPVDVIVDGTDPEPYIWPAGFTYDAALAGASRAEPAGTDAGMGGCATAPGDRGGWGRAIALLALLFVARGRRRSRPGPHSHAVPAVLPSRSSSARWKAPGP